MLVARPTKEDKERFEAVRALVINGAFWHELRQLDQLLLPFLQVTIALETIAPSMSHVFANITYLLRATTQLPLADQATLRCLVSVRFFELYYPLMAVAYLADLIEREKRPVEVQEVQVKDVGNWLIA